MDHNPSSTTADISRMNREKIHNKLTVKGVYLYERVSLKKKYYFEYFDPQITRCGKLLL